MSQANDQERKKALDLAVSQIKKQFGDGAIMSLGKHSSEREISVIKTGALSLDAALGIGGVPRGRVVEIYGPESSGKSTLSSSYCCQRPAQWWGGGLYRCGTCSRPRLCYKNRSEH